MERSAIDRYKLFFRWDSSAVTHRKGHHSRLADQRAYVLLLKETTSYFVKTFRRIKNSKNQIPYRKLSKPRVSRDCHSKQPSHTLNGSLERKYGI